MCQAEQNTGVDGQELVREGAFDDQLLIPAPFGEGRGAVRSIFKRDGREVPFDQQKISTAIFKAAYSIGGRDRDRAEQLAVAVAIYLMKHMEGATPTVDQVHDAVEKVLIEMGHARTALVYARYRDRRTRIRKLRDGDTEALLDELAEARGQRELPATRDGHPLFVRTSGERIVAWDRGRIVAALVRETALAEGVARVIGLEVEQQIRAARVSVLTAPLIRELVGAKLIEHGLEEHCRRHMRLGVPLYDAERVVCGPHPGEPPMDPVATDLVLAESVKREFALAQVFSGKVAEAHLRGEIHIHHLGFVDRLHSCVQSLEYIKRFGIGVSGARSVSRPARHADTLVAQMVHFNTALEAHVAGTVGWDALNVFFAPFVQDLSDTELRQVAQTIIFEFAHRAGTHGERVSPAEVTLSWDVPTCLRDIEAVGPGGAYTGRSYGDYAHTVQRFAWVLLDVFKEGGVGGISFPAPVPVVRLGQEFFKSPGHEVFLDHVANVVSRRCKAHVVFGRNRFEGLDSQEVWQPRYTAIQCVTVNLPRAAYRARNEGDLLSELDRLAETAVAAHLEKRQFIEKLLSLKSVGPLALLAAEREGKPFLDLDYASCLVGVTGLNECVQALTGDELHGSGEALGLACRIAGHLSACFGEHSENEDINFVLGQARDTGIAHRLATLDLHDFPEQARTVVKTDTVAHRLLYTPGAQVDKAGDCSPIERVRLEGELHEWLRADAATDVQIPDDEAAKESIAGFITKAFHQTQSHRIAFC